jgi:hypothetical protein
MTNEICRDDQIQMLDKKKYKYIHYLLYDMSRSLSILVGLLKGSVQVRLNKHSATGSHN